jgi:uncharacterized membrane protein
MKASNCAVSVLVFCSLAFASTEALAWFKVCNQRPNGVWVATGHHLTATEWNGMCGGYAFAEGCGDSHYWIWRAQGWWRIEPGECKVSLGKDLENTRSYVYAMEDDFTPVEFYVPNFGGFQITHHKFSWDEVTSEYKDPSTTECIMSTWDAFCNPNFFWADFAEVWTGDAKNFTLNLVVANSPADASPMHLRDAEQLSSSAEVPLALEGDAPTGL